MSGRIAACLILICLLFAAQVGAAGLQEQLFLAAAKGSLEAIKSAVKSGVSPDCRDRENGMTPLMVAARDGQLEAAVMLMYLGATIDARDNKGRTALMFACEQGHQALAAALADAKADVNAADKIGRTAIWYAERNGHEKIAGMLVSYGAELTTSKTKGSPDTEDEFYKVTVHYATNRKALNEGGQGRISGFGNSMNERLSYGTCSVSIPKDHVPGEIESPRFYLLELSDDPKKHITLLGITGQDEKEYFRTLKERLNKGVGKELLIFVHGFNVGFTDAAKRTAQLAFDLDFKGAPLFFSWPSTESLFQYKDDKERIDKTIPLLKEFLRNVVLHAPGAEINIIAHSMGTYGLTNALKNLVDEMKAGDAQVRFNQIILAAPDIDGKVFKEQIVPSIKKAANRITVYASSKDLALLISKYVNSGQRVGDTNPEILVFDGIDSIDVSGVDSSTLGHSYYGDNSSIIMDIKSVIGKEPPEQRTFLKIEQNKLSKIRYWLFNPVNIENAVYSQ